MDGVEPETGYTTTVFTYRVKYTDADGNPPMVGFPRAHILKGGGEITGSPFVMSYESGGYTGGAIYSFNKTLTAGTDYTYYFDAVDNTGLQSVATPVTPTPTAPVDAPDVAGPSNIDLFVSSLSASATAKPGQIISVTDTTKNKGTGASAASTTKFFWSSDTAYDGGDSYLGSRSVPSLAPGATSSGSTSVTIPPSITCTDMSTFYIIAVADADNVIAESNDTNNSKSKLIKLGPDLIISTLSAPATSGAGITITISSTTKNSGAGLAGASTTSYYLSANTTYETGDTYLGGRPVPALAAGAVNSGGISVTLPAGTLPSPYYIIGRADADGVVPETNETNNIKYRLITIQ